MFRNALLAASAIFMALLFFLLGQLRFLVPWRDLIVHRYWPEIAGFCLVLFVNLVAVIMLFERKFLLKDAGRKLAHFDKQVHTGQHALSAEIAQLEAEEE